MTKTKYVVRPNPRLQKLQREYRKQQGVFKTTYLAKVNGQIRIPGGLYWVHDPAGVDANGNTIYGAPRKMPMLAGAAILPRPNTKVDVVTVRGVDYIARTNKSELDRMGMDAHQSNSLDPGFNFKSLDWTTNLQAFKTPGASSTHIIGSIYQKPDGDYEVFPTTGGYDFVTANVPSVDMQVVVCQWLNTETNDIEVTVSSEESADTDLKHPANITTTIALINECVESAPSSHIGIWAWRIFDDTTIATLDDNNKLADLRGIVGAGRNGAIHADNLFLRDGSELTLSANTDGEITVSKARHIVDTFDDEATGDLATINGLAAGGVCLITASDTTRTIVIKHGADNIVSVTGADIVLDDHIKAVLVIRSIDDTENWAYPLMGGGASDAADVTYTPADDTDWDPDADPGNVDDALDQLAARLTDAESDIASHTHALDDLSDVTITTPAAYNSVRYNGSAWVNVKHNVTTTDPTITDDSTQGYAVWSRWLNTATDIEWICSDPTPSAAVWIESVSRLGTQTLGNKTISASANTVTTGAGVSKTISAGDVLAAGTDRNLVVSANTGSTDDLIEVTGLTVGETVLLRAASGHTISVKHNDAGATVKIHLYNNANRNLDEQNPLELKLVATNVLSENSTSTTGDVVGPGSATDNGFARWDGTSGKLLQNSPSTMDDNGAPTFVRQSFVDGSADEIQHRVQGHSAQTANLATWEDSTGNVQVSIGPNGEMVVNEEGNSTGDFRIEGDTNANLFFTDASNDNIGIGTNTPDSASLVDMVSTEKGLGLPAMTFAQAAIMDTRTGNLVYVNDNANYAQGTYEQSASGLRPVGAYAADGILFADPTNQSWSTLNQGSGTFTEDTTNRRLTIVADGNATTQLRGWYMTAPSAPYVIRLYIDALIPSVNGNGLWVGWRENTSGELAGYTYKFNSANNLMDYNVAKWNSPTSLNTTYVANTIQPTQPHWFKLTDDNTNRIISISNDGIAWIDVHSVARTDFLTPDRIFFGCVVTTNGAIDTQVSLMSFEEL